MTWYARLQTTDEDIHLHELPDAGTDQELEARAVRVDDLRREHGIPDDWSSGEYLPPARFDVSVIEGPLHEKLLAVAQLHPLEATT